MLMNHAKYQTEGGGEVFLTKPGPLLRQLQLVSLFLRFFPPSEGLNG